MSKSLLGAALANSDLETVLSVFAPEERAAIQYDWNLWARPEQIEPGTPLASSQRKDWFIWMMMAGRGGGKTRGGAEWVIKTARDNPGCRIAMIARTAADVRTTMLEGPSGIMSVSPPWFYPIHEPSKCKLTWPNGSIALHFSAEEPKGLRGPQFNAAWCDELAAWPMVPTEDGEPGVPAAWTQLEYGMRNPETRPRVVITTTPRPTALIRRLIKDPGCVVTTWSTFDNADNLAPEFIDRMRTRFEGTRLGRQELNAEILEDTPGALWTLDVLDRCRVRDVSPEDLTRIVVAIDPSGGSDPEKHDEQGIVVVGKHRDGHCYVIADCSVCLTPDGWGRRAVTAYLDYRADRILAEKNFGGQMVEFVVQSSAEKLGVSVPVTMVDASRGKLVRAEPVSALYEQGRCHHVGVYQELEQQMCTYVPGEKSQKSPDRMDALVWAVTYLMLGEGKSSFDDWGNIDLT